MIEELKKRNPEYKDVSITYVGRLDPLAEGVLILLVGDEVYNKKEYLGLDKEYIAEILLGVRTDSFDILGIADFLEISEKFDEAQLENLRGDFTDFLPPFSSYKIQGKPLHWWAKEGRLNEIDIPVRTTKIYDIETIEDFGINADELLGVILNKVDLVEGDFRQEDIKNTWKELLLEDNEFQVLRVKINCSAGTYIRSIANRLGGTLLSLTRTKVGDFDVEDSLRLL